MAETSSNPTEVSIDVIDMVIQDGTSYKPAIIRSYGRFSVMPDGRSVLEHIEELRTMIASLQESVSQLTDMINK